MCSAAPRKSASLQALLLTIQDLASNFQHPAMKYMLLIYSAENAITEEERQHCYQESTALTHELNSRGQFLGANPLQTVATATTVRIREGKRLVTDGPFAETREHLGGYFLVD